MNNIRISIDLTKVDGARLIRAAAPNGKQDYYVAVPVSSLFAPKDSNSVHLTCTMIPCPNALYGDFMLKPYVNGTTYANMSDDERKAIKIIGKGTYIQSKLDKSQAQQYEAATVESVSVEDVRSSMEPTNDQQPHPAEKVATSPKAPFPAESGTGVVTKLYVKNPEGSYICASSWDDAVKIAAGFGSEHCTIEEWTDKEQVAWYEYDLFYQSWNKRTVV